MTKSDGDSAHQIDWKPPFGDPELRQQLRFGRSIARYALIVLAINLAIGLIVLASLRGVGALRAAAGERLTERISDFGRPPVLLLGVDPIAADRVRHAIGNDFDFGAPFSSELAEAFQESVRGQPNAKVIADTRYRNLWTLLDHVNYENNERLESAALTFLSGKLRPDRLSLNHYGLQDYLWRTYIVYVDDFMLAGRFTSARALAARAAAHLRMLDTPPDIVHQVDPGSTPWYSARQNLILLLEALTSESASMYLDPVAALNLYHATLELYPFAHQALLQRRLSRATLRLMREEEPGLLALSETSLVYQEDDAADLRPGLIETKARERLDRMRRDAVLQLAAHSDVGPRRAAAAQDACPVRLVLADLDERGPLFSGDLDSAVGRIRTRVHAAASTTSVCPEQQGGGEPEAGGSEEEARDAGDSLESLLLKDEKQLSSLLAIGEPGLQRAAELLVGIVRLRAAEHAEAQRLFRLAEASASPRVRDIALLNQARAIFWQAHQILAEDEISGERRRAIASAASAQIRELRPKIRERNFATDLAYYLNQLQLLAKGPPKPAAAEGAS